MTVVDESVKIRKQDKVVWMERGKLQDASVRTAGASATATVQL